MPVAMGAVLCFVLCAHAPRAHTTARVHTNVLSLPTTLGLHYHHGKLETLPSSSRALDAHREEPRISHCYFDTHALACQRRRQTCEAAVPARMLRDEVANHGVRRAEPVAGERGPGNGRAWGGKLLLASLPV